jgi:hypothetical protein
VFLWWFLIGVVDVYGEVSVGVYDKQEKLHTRTITILTSEIKVTIIELG